MTKPGFLPFLMQHPNSILIIEDAENIVRDRQQESFLPNQAVANLLNLSDGLLGDAMHQQIICTFNCDVKGIDPALLRDGRLVIEHKFEKLSVENARRLCVQLAVPGNGQDIHESISLAEIYARKNAAVGDSTNGLENGHTKKNSKRPLKKRSQQQNSFFGFYS
jgi:SpoVK/Ycf46/Vps4 family AAA+-type ATPase